MNQNHWSKQERGEINLTTTTTEAYFVPAMRHARALFFMKQKNSIFIFSILIDQERFCLCTHS